ncbi:MAG: hypothetical protein V1810_04115 [Candidatus Beckwithbacteria bacterium]
MNQEAKDFLINRGKAVGWRLGGTGLSLAGQWLGEKIAATRLQIINERIISLGQVGDSGLSYQDLAQQISLPSLAKATEHFDSISLPHHLNPVAMASGFMLAAFSLLVDLKNGDWVSRTAEKLEYDYDRENLAKAVKFGGRLIQLASAGAIALTPAIITKAMEMKMSAEQLATSWEGFVALMGLAGLAFSLAPAVKDAFKAGMAEKRRHQPAIEVVQAAAKAFVRPKEFDVVE